MHMCLFQAAALRSSWFNSMRKGTPLSLCPLLLQRSRSDTLQVIHLLPTYITPPCKVRHISTGTVRVLQRGNTQNRWRTAAGISRGLHARPSGERPQSLPSATKRAHSGSIGTPLDSPFSSSGTSEMSARTVMQYSFSTHCALTKQAGNQVRPAQARVRVVGLKRGHNTALPVRYVVYIHSLYALPAL